LVGNDHHALKEVGNVGARVADPQRIVAGKLRPLRMGGNQLIDGGEKLVFGLLIDLG